jgi:hypothetical protein
MQTHILKKVGSFFVVLLLCVYTALPVTGDGNLEKKNGLTSTDSAAVVDKKVRAQVYDDEGEADMHDVKSRSSYNLIFYLLYRFITNNPLTTKH